MGIINGGVKNNIMAENVKLEGTIRTFCEENLEYVLTYLQDRMKEIEEETKATIKATLTSHLPALINNPDLVKMGSKVGKEVFGDKFVLGEKPFLAGDNAAYYFRLVPGVRMVFFAEKENEENYPLHNGKFDFNEDIFPYAVCALYNVISTIE